MSPEAKAREIVHQISTHSQIFESDVELVAQALRDVERETLERAAKWHDDQALSIRKRETKLRIAGLKVPLAELCEATLHESSAQSIRSLLQKEGG